MKLGITTVRQKETLISTIRKELKHLNTELEKYVGGSLTTYRMESEIEDLTTILNQLESDKSLKDTEPSLDYILEHSM